ncbi:MAG: hypothetical protein KDK39_15470 [Leptospiraceae bacterium]|nr:hypothetical protein [Leptospiraceae bacterium]
MAKAVLSGYGIHTSIKDAEGRLDVRWDTGPADLTSRYELNERSLSLACPQTMNGPSGKPKNTKIPPGTAMVEFAARHALQNAGLDTFDAYRTAVVVASMSNGRDYDLKNVLNPEENSAAESGLLETMLQSPAWHLAKEIGARSYVQNLSATNQGGLAALAKGLRLIEENHADIVLVGSCDTARNSGNPAAMLSAGLSAENEGFNGHSSEGGFVLVLESIDHALARRAGQMVPVYAPSPANGEYRLPDSAGATLARTIHSLLQGMQGNQATRIESVFGLAKGPARMQAVEARAMLDFFGDQINQINLVSLAKQVGCFWQGNGLLHVCLAFECLIQKPDPALFELDREQYLSGARPGRKVAGKVIPANALVVDQSISGQFHSVLLGR